VGFEKSAKLRPAAWRPLLDADLETAKAMSGLLTLADVARRDERFSETECDALSSTAHELIGPFVLALNEWRVENHHPVQGKSAPPPMAPYSSSGKVGRNDPCPCGSAKNTKNAATSTDPRSSDHAYDRLESSRTASSALLTEFGDVFGRQGRDSGAETRDDVIGDGGDLGVGIGGAERRHHHHAMRRLTPLARQHNLRDVGGAAVIDRAVAG
jgi:hypothetical protein